MSAHKAEIAFAQAALLEIISRGQALQAAVLRGATQDEIETIRAETHDVLDAYLDHTASAATHVRQIIEP